MVNNVSYFRYAKIQIISISTNKKHIINTTLTYKLKMLIYLQGMKNCRIFVV